jgi:hypothetical protein
MHTEEDEEDFEIEISQEALDAIDEAQQKFREAQERRRQRERELERYDRD